MAVYEFKCKRCGWKFEKLSLMSEMPEFVECPKCGEQAKRRFSKINWTFGWKMSDESNNVKGTPDYFERDM